MATNSTVTYVPALVGDLDVISTYKELMEASTGQNSAYIRAKETLVDLLDKGELKDVDKATVIAQTITGIATGITTHAMDVAVKIATENRNSKYVLTKMREDTKLTTAQAAKIEEEILHIGTTKNIETMQGWKLQAELHRDYGVIPTSIALTSPLLGDAYADYGTKVETLKKAKVDTYATYANSYRTNGKVNYTTNILTGQFDAVAGDGYGLTVAQTNVAIRQEKGFDDNMNQHVVNSSASLAGLLLSTDQAALVPQAAEVIGRWNSAADNLITTP